MSLLPNVPKDNPRDSLREEEPRDDETKSPIDDDDEEFPTSIIRVLLVSDDQSFRRMDNIPTQFFYEVTIYENGDKAIAYLMKNKHEIDLVIWDDHVPVVYGLEDLINTIDKKMDLPVVIISDDHSKKTVMKYLKYGACDFLLKPLSKEVTAVLWKHVYRKKMSKSSHGSVDESPDPQEEGSKKPRMKWYPKLHKSFVKAVRELGPNKAVPKMILESMEKDMDVKGLTRPQVASHLQKYRGKKKSGVLQETRQDSRLNSGPNTALTASTPLLNSRFTGVPYNQAAANAHVTRQYSGRRNSGPNTALTASTPLLNSRFTGVPYNQATANAHVTRQDSGRRNSGPNTALTASTPLLNSRLPYDQAAANAHVTRQDYGWLGSSFNLHTREPYFTNDQATARALIQYPSTIYLAMTNPLANLPYTDSFHQPLLQQQQQYDQSYLQLPSVTPTQDTAHVSSAMENQNQNSPLIDLNEPPPADNLDPPA